MFLSDNSKNLYDLSITINVSSTVFIRQHFFIKIKEKLKRLFNKSCEIQILFLIEMVSNI
jgi:hypothetical protein